MGEEELHQLINGCVKQDRKSQKMLYKAFYGFSMGICLRYAGNRDEAAEVMNQGFMKVFTHIDRFDTSRPFKAWIGRIMMNVSIDYYRANLKMAYTEDLEKAENVSEGDLTDKNLNYEDLLAMVHQLPQAYRTVFNLFAIDGYSHEEIGEMLNINPGTSKSNLHKARQKLKQMILKAEETANKTNYNRGMDINPIVAYNGIGIDVRTTFFNNGIRG
ncbi:sigma-70 family RNA polymerase sigma factor [Mucilaginibacter rubeus]|uniref:Sigma-70 family RNA polymerase sigma factor n=1 Tax=Mucilaginibacter rubeus TaxID=2027860 RepID=A0AAE6MI77_9SPHI|nr:MULTISPECIES: sigma-70 family RNA polymerase sigma factor [Mucilaginibacter]QEM04341.1 sigma-70 family RNA polymerase sigma factor [Mucilaginibacter rubeus]QEM16940.1 sigma-70 family RNA polymerase sigma factor [Mucilaginibacter gossypii]QTE46568.1 sigma-70 family RNA polymerase sigma factor [Mucilaginibacter rubeus]QTE53165.1 sigma-70 family RNA polymerase sigma factor [Mucilaginibacter rubeus]QTE58253.1 sigma-70 family RNA polymerase sigma factor [Mucilaginibacter rubeus]